MKEKYVRVYSHWFDTQFWSWDENSIHYISEAVYWL